MMEPTRVSAAGVSRWLAVVSTLALTLVASPARADPGDPIAVSRWPGGAITVETHWGLQLVIAPATPPPGQVPRPVGSVLIEPTEHYHHLLERRPNEATVKWRRRAPGEVKTRPNAVQVDTLAEDADGHSLVRISVDSATIVIAPPDYQPTALSKNADALPTTDLLVLGVAAGAGDPGAGAKRLADLLNPSVVVMNPAKDVQPNTLKQVQESLGMRSAGPRQHNSLCVAAGSTDEQAPYSVLLGESPWEASGELESLFTAMEQACLNSQQVFKDLTTEQLNFQPANGTHTPRWNAEHMIGRQLQFFSQIYHAVDPTIAVRDLNPRQNPEDYRAAHPDWDGEEEARQMQRVSDFTRRFAYLLDGVSLDKPAPGSRWTLRRLLRQMPRHYDEHTANTMKKFDLPGWPGDPPASR